MQGSDWGPLFLLAEQHFVDLGGGLAVGQSCQILVDIGGFVEAPEEEDNATAAETAVATFQAIDAGIVGGGFLFPLRTLHHMVGTSASSSSILKRPSKEVKKLPRATLPVWEVR